MIEADYQKDRFKNLNREDVLYDKDLKYYQSIDKMLSVLENILEITSNGNIYKVEVLQFFIQNRTKIVLTSRNYKDDSFKVKVFSINENKITNVKSMHEYKTYKNALKKFEDLKKELN